MFYIGLFGSEPSSHCYSIILGSWNIPSINFLCAFEFSFLLLANTPVILYFLDEDNLEKTTTKLNQTDLDLPSGVGGKQEDTECSSMSACSELPAPCLQCSFNLSCVYGENTPVNCTAAASAKCEGDRKFTKEFICRYCYQTDHWEHTCVRKANCNAVAAPRVYYRSNCTVHGDVLCLGRRVFNKNLLCNWTGGYRWSTALILSVTLGGFGADRFYLGHWQEGIGKLFSFGGLGVWTLIDVILISLRYLGPADGSLYI